MIASLLDLSSAHSPLDLTVAAASSAVLLLSLSAVALVLLFLLRASRSSRRSDLRFVGLNSLWPVRLLLVLFSALWSLAELLRLPLLHLPLPPADLCPAYLFVSQTLAEPAFFATLLFLLRASTHQPKASTVSAGTAFTAALLAAIATALPFLLLHVFFLNFPPSVLGLPSNAFGPASYVVGDNPPRCGYPLFTTVLLAGLGIVYVPLFISASWAAVTVVINKRLRLRLYALAGAVVVALSVQVSTLMVSALMTLDRTKTQFLDLGAFLGVFAAVVAGEGILVIQPVVDALSVVQTQLGACSRHGNMDAEEG